MSEFTVRPTDPQIWEYAAAVDRSNPVIAIVQQQQGMTDAQIYDLFREAAKR